MRPQVTDVVTNIVRRQSLDAKIVLACICGAPGVFKSHKSIEDNWPSCYVEPGDPKDSQPVGSHCPQCGRVRPGEKDLGEVWAREWRIRPPNPIFNLIRKVLK